MPLDIHLSRGGPMINKITMETVACLRSKCHLKQNLIPSCISDFRCKTKYSIAGPCDFLPTRPTVRRISKSLLVLFFYFFSDFTSKETMHTLIEKFYPSFDRGISNLTSASQQELLQQKKMNIHEGKTRNLRTGHLRNRKCNWYAGTITINSELDSASNDIYFLNMQLFPW
jgi:hypothetical protein